MNSGDYFLKKRLNNIERQRLAIILYSIGYLEDIKIYFFGKDSIKKELIKRLIFIEKNSPTFYENIKAEFIADRFFLIFPDRKLEFYKDSFREYNVHYSIVAFFLEKIGRITHIFLRYRNPIINTILFISMAFFIQSIVSFISFKDYRFISFMINFIFIFFPPLKMETSTSSPGEYFFKTELKFPKFLILSEFIAVIMSSALMPNFSAGLPGVNPLTFKPYSLSSNAGIIPNHTFAYPLSVGW